ISPDGNSLVGGTRDGKTIVWNTSGDYEANVIYNDPGNAVQSVSYSPNGRYLACGTLNGNVLVFRAGSYELITELPGHTARVTEIDFSPNSSYLASSAYDGKILLWNMANLRGGPAVFNDNGGFVFTVRFSTDGKNLVGGSAQESRLVSRPVSATQLADRVCFLVSRNFTQAEWDRFVAPDIPYEKTCSDK
ncbi:MAG: WD40 repeat domain-containing protein, partial [Bacteroidales bacterium]